MADIIIILVASCGMLGMVNTYMYIERVVKVTKQQEALIIEV